MPRRLVSKPVCQWNDLVGCFGIEPEETFCGDRVEWVVGPTEYGMFDLCTDHAERVTESLPEVKMREFR